jgi:hypothetical protein
MSQSITNSPLGPVAIPMLYGAALHHRTICARSVVARVSQFVNPGSGRLSPGRRGKTYHPRSASCSARLIRRSVITGRLHPGWSLSCLSFVGSCLSRSKGKLQEVRLFRVLCPSCTLLGIENAGRINLPLKSRKKRGPGRSRVLRLIRNSRVQRMCSDSCPKYTIFIVGSSLSHPLLLKSNSPF